MADTSERYARIAADFTARVEGCGPDAWSASSPCEEWTARDVVTHVVDNHRRNIAGLSDTEPTPVSADEDVVAAWRSTSEEMKAALGDPDKAAKTMNSPFGPMPFEQLVGRMVCTDTLVHTWDLARATGQDESLDADSVKGAYAGLKPLDAMVRQPHLFGPKVEPPEGADEQTEFLSFLGRSV